MSKPHTTRKGSQYEGTVPALVDRLVERALLRVLDPVIDPLLLPWSFAYRRGLGARDALAALAEARDQGMAWVARADIDDCFDHIPQWEVMRRLREVVDDQRVVHLVGLLLDRPVVGGRTRPDHRGLGLHHGSVLAPLLSNLYLDAFDRAMLSAGWRVIRYSDDLAIPTESRVDAERALLSAATEFAGAAAGAQRRQGARGVIRGRSAVSRRDDHGLDRQPRRNALAPAGDRRLRRPAGGTGPQPG